MLIDARDAVLMKITDGVSEGQFAQVLEKGTSY